MVSVRYVPSLLLTLALTAEAKWACWMAEADALPLLSFRDAPQPQFLQ